LALSVTAPLIDYIVRDILSMLGFDNSRNAKFKPAYSCRCAPACVCLRGISG